MTAPTERRGLALALLASTQFVLILDAAMVALATARTDAVDAAQRVALNEGYQAGFLGGAALALLGALLALLLLSTRESREYAEAARRGELDQPEPARAAA
jgi:hypothetical protein